MATRKYTSNAERQRAYRERQRTLAKANLAQKLGVAERNAGSVTDVQRAEWRRWYRSDVVALLVQIAELGGERAGQLAAQALELALDEDRAWAAVRDLDGTTQGYNLKLLVKRKDLRVIQFLDDCKYLR